MVMGWMLTVQSVQGSGPEGGGSGSA